jgi:capsular polysaccharide transport system permease protein
MVRAAAAAILGPTLLTAVYLAVIAPAQYTSTTAFAIRGAEVRGPDMLGAVGILAPTATSTDARIVSDYIRSPAMVETLRKQYGFNETYSRFSLDPFSRLSPKAPIENATEFWRRKVRVTYDHAAGSTTVTVQSSRPEDSLRLTRGVLAASEALVNSMSDRALGDLAMASAEDLKRKKAELDEAKRRLASFQARNAVVPASAPAQQAIGVVGAIDAQLAAKRVEAATAEQTFQPLSPQIVALRRQIDALEAERARAVARATSGVGESAASGEVEARTVLMDYEFAQKSYRVAQEAVEAARRQGTTERKYVVSYVPPQLPERSNYFSRFSTVLAVFFACALLWGVGALTWSVVKDHVQ